MAENPPINIAYRFEMTDGTEACFDLALDPESLVLKNNRTGPAPRWTCLTFHQCPHCPRTRNDGEWCPVALNLVPLVERFDRLISFETVQANVTVQARQVSVVTSVQEALSSLMGILIAASDCRHTDFFKPMVRFHQPFASREETLCRAVATYLLSQYLEAEQWGNADPDLSGLAEIYKNIQILNDYMVSRIRAATTRDSAVNALVHLDVIAKYLAPTMEDALDEVYHMFAPLMAEGVDALMMQQTARPVCER